MYVRPPRRLRARAIITILGLIVSMAYGTGTTALVYAHRPVPESLDIIASAATTLFAAVAFMAWLHRARVNLDGLGVVGLRWRPGWTIGGWIIPLANLVIPLLVVREVDRASQERAAAVGGAGQVRAPGLLRAGQVRPAAAGRGRPSGHAVFLLWAIAWIGYLVAGIGLEYPPSTGPVTVLSTVLMLVAGVFAILLVRRITAFQDEAMTMPPPAQPVLAGPPQALSPSRPQPALPPPTSQSPPAQQPVAQQPVAQQPVAQQPVAQVPPAQVPPAQVPPDAQPPTGPAVDPWPDAGY